MNLLQKSLSDHVSGVLGIDLKLEGWSKATSLPRFLSDTYEFYYADFLAIPHLFLISKGENEGTPASIRKHIALVKEKFSGEIVFVCPRISQHNRNRLIERGISFIVPGNQLFLPTSGIALREYFRRARQKRRVFSPSAQVLVLDAMVNGHYGPTTSARLVHTLHYSAMTLTRAFDEIEASELGAVENRGRERILTFEDKGRNLWEKALPFLRSPVKRVLYVHFTEKELKHPTAGLTALAQQTMIGEPEYPVYALTVDQFRAIESQVNIVPDLEPGAICLEVWRYSPGLLGQNDRSDPLSLYLSLKDSTDERVVAEAQTMLEAFFGTRN